MEVILHHPTGHLTGQVPLPSSKSESNRVLIMQALSQGRIQVENLSSAQDTQTLKKLLLENPETMDVGHAGTAMRFLSAYLAFRPEDKILTGSTRMQERPIGLLVDTLRQMGADIQYLNEEGYPPLAIYGRNSRWGEDEVQIQGDVSSQYITALLMIAPTLPDGLRLEITGTCRSWPYIEMTLALMEQFVIQHTLAGNKISIARQSYQGGPYKVEGDWSGASYWFVATGLAETSEIILPGLSPKSLQGDAIVLKWVKSLGVKSTWEAEGLCLRRETGQTLPQTVQWDFKDCPDLAQGLMVLLAGLGVNGSFTGLQSLRIKETDRIAAMQTELGKLGIRLVEDGDTWQLEGKLLPRATTIHTYEDHRMAMAFAPLVLKVPGLRIADAEVVSKSYPDFWKAMQVVGFEVNEA